MPVTNWEIIKICTLVQPRYKCSATKLEFSLATIYESLTLIQTKETTHDNVHLKK